MTVIAPEPQEKNGQPDEETREDIRRELEVEATKADGLMAEATAELKQRIAGLEREILLKNEDIEALERSLEATVKELEGAKAAYAYAVEDFKQLACSLSPLIPPEVITGSTIEEVKASMRRANDLVVRVKQAIAEQAKEVMVPAGAPTRGEPDLSGMSAKEKIAYAVRNRQKNERS